MATKAEKALRERVRQLEATRDVGIDRLAQAQARVKELEQRNAVQAENVGEAMRQNTRLVEWNTKAALLLGEAAAELESEARNYADVGKHGMTKYQPHGMSLLAVAKRLRQHAAAASVAALEAVSENES
jgi:hypothetical protein